MENSSTSTFTNLLNSSISSSNSQNPQNNQQNHGLPLSFTMMYPSYQFGPNFKPPYPPNFNLFGAQAGYQQFQSSNYHNVSFPGNFGAFQPGSAGGPSSPVGSATLFGAAGGSGSRGDEYSPASSPTVPAENTNKGFVIEELSDVDSDQGGKSGRKYWSQTDNERLIRAWLDNSVKPLDGNSKKGPHYWRDVAAQYNSEAPKGQKRSAIQCKNHWNTVSALVSKFHGCWTVMNNTYASGQSHQQLMEKVHAEYKVVQETDKPFAFEYWWNAVKDEPKWLNRVVLAAEMSKRNKVSASGAYTSSSNQVAAEMSKRNKVSASGAYTSSSNQETDEERPRPIGQKQAKAQQRGTGKGKGKGALTDENVGQFNVVQEQKKESIENMAAAAREHAQAIASHVAVEKEKVKVDKMKHLTELLKMDTSSYSEAQKAVHEKMVLHLSDDLYRDE